MFSFIDHNKKLRAFLGKTGLLPHTLKRNGTDRRVQSDRRIKNDHEYLAIIAADRRFEPDRRTLYDRRSGGYEF